MNKALLGYALFSAVLLAFYFLIPEFLFSHVIAICLAALSVIKFIPQLSTIVLSVIAAIVTIAFPMVTLYLIGRDFSMSPLDGRYMTPFNVLQWVLPTVATVLVVLVLKFFRRTQSH